MFPWLVYDDCNQCRGGCVHAEDAAALVAFLGDGSTVRWAASGRTVWREGVEQESASESFDGAAATMHARAEA